jgi:hypothetical protein
VVARLEIWELQPQIKKRTGHSADLSKHLTVRWHARQCATTSSATSRILQARGDDRKHNNKAKQRCTATQGDACLDVPRVGPRLSISKVFVRQRASRLQVRV